MNSGRPSRLDDYSNCGHVYQCILSLSRTYSLGLVPLSKENNQKFQSKYLSVTKINITHLHVMEKPSTFKM